jgi:hypothetical protein
VLDEALAFLPVSTARKNKLLTMSLCDSKRKITNKFKL